MTKFFIHPFYNFSKKSYYWQQNPLDFSFDGGESYTKEQIDEGRKGSKVDTCCQEPNVFLKDARGLC